MSTCGIRATPKVKRILSARNYGIPGTSTVCWETFGNCALMDTARNTTRSRHLLQRRKASDSSKSDGKCFLQFFCICCPCQPNATTMRTKTGAIVDLCDFPENNANPTPSQRQSEGRSAGLKI